MIRILLTVFFISCTTLLWSQNDQQKKLEQRKLEIQKEIKEFQELLAKESKREKTVTSEIADKNTKISLSEKLIATTQKQTKLLNDDMYLNQLQINKLNRELDALKDDYSKTIVKAYKSRSDQSRIMFILSSNSFLQAYKRIQYMKHYASFRKIQGEEINTKMTQLNALNDKLTLQKQEKKKLLAESEKEKKVLKKDRAEQEKLVKSIQKDKKKYTADIKKRQQEANKIQKQIDKIIKDAIAAANRKAAAEAAAAAAKKKGASAAEVKKAASKAAASASVTKIELTKEGKIIADNFKANKGNLPWPVAEGGISQRFGTYSDPVYPDNKIENHGIDITTKPGENVRAVFGGEVGDIQVVPGTNNKIVYIKHGNYFTVYYNLKSINVSSGDKVSTKQSIGKVATSPSGKTILSFYILQNTTYINPQSWITQ